MQISPDLGARRQTPTGQLDPSRESSGARAGEAYKAGQSEVGISLSLVSGQPGSSNVSSASRPLARLSTLPSVSVPGGDYVRGPSSDAPRQPSRSPLRRGGDAPGQPPGLRILLVEDHPDTAAALAQLLGAMGHQATVANTMAAALDVAARQPFDLVVSDIGLPDGDGHQLMRELALRYHLCGIAVSGYGMEEDRRRSLSAGFRFHLTKPISLSQLQAAIAQAAAPQG
jgi:CheY-like chemotaxis protein